MTGSLQNTEQETAPARRAAGVEITQPPSLVRQKLGQGAVIPMRLDPRILRRMELAVETMSGAYAKTLKTEIRAMMNAHAEWEEGDSTKIHHVYAIAHEIRGLAGTFARPMTGRVANQLCLYLEALPELTRAEEGVVRLHVDAMHAAATGAREPCTEVADATLAGLDRLVSRAIEHLPQKTALCRSVG